MSPHPSLLRCLLMTAIALSLGGCVKVFIIGHTDDQPMQSARFPSNWELSTARALAIVKYLVVQGIPAHRLSANGFGQFQPLDNGDSADAYARNRRIELQLTNR